MNSYAYIFGELLNGYSQYPKDSSSNLFKDIQDQCVATSQLIIHRDESVMYYIYIRKFEDDKYIGFAIAINGYYITQVRPVFSLFEKKIEDLIETGVIINLSNDGEITTHLSSLMNEEGEVLSVINSLQIKVNALKDIKKLPPVDFSVAISSRKIFQDTDAVSEIVSASYRFGFTIVLKESDYDTVRTKSYRCILKNLNEDKNALIAENEGLKEQNKEIQLQKKQFKNVVILVLMVVACGIGIYFLNENLNVTQSALNVANDIVSEQNDIIHTKDSTISRVRDSVSNLEYALNREVSAKERADSSLQNICSYIPFAVTNCELNAEQFKFNYFCLEEKELTVTLKILNEDTGKIVTSTYTLTFYKGTGSESFDFSRSLNTSHNYHVVLMYNDYIIAGKRL